MLKQLVRNTLIKLHFDVSKNLKYDRLTNRVMKSVIRSDSNCIDVGSHKGEVLNEMIKLAPFGNHFAFEPIPEMFQKLETRYASKVNVSPKALSNRIGTSQFHWVKNAPAYSGIKERKYEKGKPDIEIVDVELDTLDHCIPNNVRIDFIKIDVEGGEFDVLKGAVNLITRCKPIIVFECGLGASEYYQTNVIELYDFLVQIVGLKLYTLQRYTANMTQLSKSEFTECYNNNSEYYFVAA